jgi:hypothetical protein
MLAGGTTVVVVVLGAVVVELAAGDRLVEVAAPTLPFLLW